MSSSSYEWQFAYDTGQSKKKPKAGVEVSDHPLKPLVSSVTDSKILRKLGASTSNSTASSTPTPAPLDPLVAALDGSDPLSQFLRLELDPLSRMAADERNAGKHTQKSTPANERFEPWANRRSAILNKFTTSEKLCMVLSAGGDKVVVKQVQVSAVDKVKTRLEQLDELDEESERQTLELTQQEYVTRIEQMNKELVHAWNQDQRVKALKIVIQVSKMLGDISVMQFYPSKFVIISDILDIFGKLVYERLRTKAEYIASGSKVPTALPENFTSDMVPESAKETCRNWFFKIASIRELIPRLYCEMAILKSYRFLTSSEFTNALLRITKMIRGIGDPLVAIYARCYLCRVGLNLSSRQEFLRENFYDFLTTYKQLESGRTWALLTEQSTTMPVYQNMYSPALNFILQAAAVHNPEVFLSQLLTRCEENLHHVLVLNTIINSFPPEIISHRGLEFVEAASKCGRHGLPLATVLKSLGQCFSQAEPPSEQALVILNEVWKMVSRLENVEDYVACAQVWVHFIVSHFTSREINTFLGDLLAHVISDKVYENFYGQLSSIIKTVITESHDIESLLTMDKFLPLMDVLQKESVRVEICKAVLFKLTESPNVMVNDPVIINALMFVSKALHESVSFVTIEDERRQISDLISGFIKGVDFGRDLEQQLNFYMEARAAFTNLDSVACELVHSVVRLAVMAWRAVRGHHTRKTAAFVRACAAYCFITIPSISSVLAKLELYLLAGQAALLNVCLGQADACFRAALAIVPELPTTLPSDGRMKSTETFLVSYLSDFLSTLLLVPDNPESGVMYLTRGLINVAQSYPWDSGSSGKAHVYLRALDMLHAAAQETYPYHILHVDSNDSLYGWDPKFTTELNKMASVLVDEILAHLKVLGQEEKFKQQAALALEVFNRVVLLADLNQPPLATLALNLWNLAQKQGCLDIKLAKRTKEYLHRQVMGRGNNYATLLSKLQLPRLET